MSNSPKQMLARQERDNRAAAAQLAERLGPAVLTCSQCGTTDREDVDTDDGYSHCCNEPVNYTHPHAR